ncbi:MAG: LysR family transcriptional regulator substrate-binding protein [Myxococcales bacterium]|nr:LysR family transcriptional regulator substrate-binding protein [Myxococcales bacterium]
MITRGHLEAFLEVAAAESIQAAAKKSGRSRATYHRQLAELRALLGAPELLARAPGQRHTVLTPAGAALRDRAQALLSRWDRWEAETRDALGAAAHRVRVGALAGAFDLLADVVAELGGPYVLVEYPGDRLAAAVSQGAVDLGFGTRTPDAEARNLAFEPWGPLPWAVILPAAQAERFGERVSLAELHDVPMVVHRGGPARALLDQHFASHPAGPLTLVAACEVESTPRMVDMVARGFGPAVVSLFRLRFLPDEGVVARPLVDGPPALEAGVYSRRGAPLGAEARRLADAGWEAFGAVLRAQSVGSRRAR